MVKFIKFAVIGGAATLLQFLLLGIFVELMGMAPILASASSYACSSVFNYLANYYFTFTSKQSHSQTLPKFIVTVAIGLGLNTALFSFFLFSLNNYLLIGTNLLAAAYLIAQLFATLLTLIVNYLMHKLWIYRRK
jgi:putative flippase GtrA